MLFCCSVVVEALEGKEISPSIITTLTNKNLSEEDASVIYSGLLQLLQAALRSPQHSLKQEVTIIPHCSEQLIMFFPTAMSLHCFHIQQNILSFIFRCLKKI